MTKRLRTCLLTGVLAGGCAAPQAPDAPASQGQAQAPALPSAAVPKTDVAPPKAAPRPRLAPGAKVHELIPAEAKQLLAAANIAPDVALGSFRPVEDSLAVGHGGTRAVLKYQYRSEGTLDLIRAGDRWLVSNSLSGAQPLAGLPAGLGTPAAVAGWLNDRAHLLAARIGGTFPLTAFAGLDVDLDELRGVAVTAETVPGGAGAARLRFVLTGDPVAVALAGALTGDVFTPTAVLTIDGKAPADYLRARGVRGGRP